MILDNQNQQPIDLASQLNKKEIDSAITPSPIRPFPYYPPVVSEEEKKRMEVMMELNKWANNDPFMAKRAAETLILLISDQFEINIVQLEK